MGGGDDLDSGDFFDELEAAEARLALEKTRERFERLRSGRGFRNEEDEVQNRQFIQNRIEQLQYEEHEELQRLAEEDVARRNPYASSQYWLTQVKTNGKQRKDRITEVDERRSNWLTSMAKATHAINEDNQSNHLDTEVTSTVQEEREEESTLEPVLSDADAEEDNAEYDSDDERLLERALGGASMLRKRFERVLKKEDVGNATSLDDQHSPEDEQTTQILAEKLGKGGFLEGPPKWRDRLLVSANTKDVSPSIVDDTVDSTLVQPPNEEASTDAVLYDGEEVDDASGERPCPLAKVKLTGLESELTLPSFDDVERELMQSLVLLSFDHFSAGVDAFRNLSVEENDLTEADRGPDEICAQQTVRRRKGLFSKRLEEVEETHDIPVLPVITSSISCDDVPDLSIGPDLGSASAQSIGIGVPGIADLLSAIDRDLQQDSPDVDSRDLFFQLGKVKKGDWSSSDEEASDHEEGNSPQPLCQEEEKVDDSESESDEHEGGNSEEQQASEEDHPGRFIHSSLTAMQARQQRKVQLRENAKQRYSEAFAAAVCERHRGRTFSSRAASSSDHPRESTGMPIVRPKKVATMPRSQAIGYPSSSGWSFGPGVNFSSRG